MDDQLHRLSIEIEQSEPDADDYSAQVFADKEGDAIFSYSGVPLATVLASITRDLTRGSADEQEDEEDDLYARLRPFDKVVITYHGYGDEGHIEEITPEPLPEGMSISDDLERELEQLAYNILEDNYGGWEINEGSDGEITIDVKGRKILVHHGWTVESKDWEDKEVIL